MFNKLLNSNGNFNKLLKSIDNLEKINIFGFTDNEKVAVFSDSDNFLLYVASNKERVNSLKDSLELSGKNVLVLQDEISHNFLGFKSNAEIAFSEAINNINNNTVNALVITPQVLLNKIYKPKIENENKLTLTINNSYKLNQIANKLVGFNYSKVEFAEEQGNFAIRGDILDVFLHNSSNPIRFSFFGDELEFIKEYNNLTQNTISELDEITISHNEVLEVSPQEMQIAKENIENQINKLSRESAEILEDIYGYVFNETNNKNFWLSVFGEKNNSSLLDFLPQNTTIAFDDQKQVYDVLQHFLNEYSDSFNHLVFEGKLMPEHKDFYFSVKEILQKLSGFGLVAFSSLSATNNLFAPQKVFNIRCLNLPNYFNNKNVLVYDVSQFSKQQFTQVLFAGSAEYANTLQQLFQQSGIMSVVVNTRSAVVPQTVNIVTRQDNVSFAILEEKVAVVGTSKLLKSSAGLRVSKKDATKPTHDFSDVLPEIGDFIVHDLHGIGKCVGVEKITINNLTKDYVVLEYKNNDKLFLPVENLDSISKYIGGTEQPKLNKLGGVEFYRSKEKVKKDLQQTARELIELYNQRINLKGIKFPEDDELQKQFEQNFAYTETPDQIKVINEIKKDMQSEKVMDRLLCADVGYGKTEVAMRAIFKAVIAGYQVAFLCPTTILSQQHYNTLISRTEGFGVRTEVLNRFKSKAEQKEIVKKIANGEVDVVIGTHRLLSNDIKFKKLGFLVLDEEQKFGVVDKEKIKTLKSNIDVLSLSATPIPRSLHMSLVGIRDISVIETPPPLKMPVITTVTEQKDSLIKQAISDEINRGGQVLVVFNNVYGIYSFYTKIKNLINNDDITIGVAHGQMTEQELENQINNLYNQSTQVLISTTLIENGIDLPTANTIIVINADKLGLSQLYQLKGRVGRGVNQSFAYFMYDYSKVLNQNAVKRLMAIGEYTSLGDGYKIAMKDLEIRGAGSVFGVKQSGHMQQVGYNMYVKLLKHAVSEMKGEKIETTYDVKIDSDINANLPNYYVSSTLRRMQIYSEIAKLHSLDDMFKLLDKLKENYGDVPHELQTLCYIGVVKNVAKTLPIKRIKIKLKETVIEFLNYNEEVEHKIVQYYKNNKKNVVLNSNNLPIITLSNYDSAEKGFVLLKNFLKSVK